MIFPMIRSKEIKIFKIYEEIMYMKDKKIKVEKEKEKRDELIPHYYQTSKSKFTQRTEK